jgi:hypothetical protein
LYFVRFRLHRPGDHPVLGCAWRQDNEQVLAARPLGYWRFEQVSADQVPNEIAGGPALNHPWPAAVVASASDNRVLSLHRDDRDRWLDCRLPSNRKCLMFFVQLRIAGSSRSSTSR